MRPAMKLRNDKAPRLRLGQLADPCARRYKFQKQSSKKSITSISSIATDRCQTHSFPDAPAEIWPRSGCPGQPTDAPVRVAAAAGSGAGARAGRRHVNGLRAPPSAFENFGISVPWYTASCGAILFRSSRNFLPAMARWPYDFGITEINFPRPLEALKFWKFRNDAHQSS